MGAIGRLTRKMVKHTKPIKYMAREKEWPRELTGFYAGMTPEQQEHFVEVPMEMSRRELEELTTVGAIQPSHPSRYQSHGIEFKGSVYNGECNRAACSRRGAIFYNCGTYSYYCPSCAHAINGCSGNKPLCVRVARNLLRDEMDQCWKDQY
jgi:hypothetical protein